jgi:hypothetical protein
MLVNDAFIFMEGKIMRFDPFLILNVYFDASLKAQ